VIGGMIVSSSVEAPRPLARITSMSAGVTCAGFNDDAKKDLRLGEPKGAFPERVGRASTDATSAMIDAVSSAASSVPSANQRPRTLQRNAASAASIECWFTTGAT
jgi:hypothetical protein